MNFCLWGEGLFLLHVKGESREADKAVKVPPLTPASTATKHLYSCATGEPLSGLLTYPSISHEHLVEACAEKPIPDTLAHIGL